MPNLKMNTMKTTSAGLLKRRDRRNADEHLSQTESFAMFEVGKNYRFVTLETGDNADGQWATYETSIVHEVAAVDGTLVKVLGPDWSKVPDHLLNANRDRNQPRSQSIINTASLFFVRAELVSD